MSDELRVIEGGADGPRAVLKSLSMTGFKSFVHKTTLEFAPGITAVIGPNGSGKCTRFSTRVAISDGSQRAIGEIVEDALSTGDVEVVDDGFIARRPRRDVEVVTLDPSSLRLGTRPVTAYVKRRSPETLIRVRTRAGRVIEATKYHPLFTIDRGAVRAVRADELAKGTFIASPREIPISADRTALPLIRTLDAFGPADRIDAPGSPALVAWATSVSADWGMSLSAPTRELLAQASAGRSVPTSALLDAADEAGSMPDLEPVIRRRNGKSIRVPLGLSPDLARFFGLAISEGRSLPAQLWFANSERAVNDDYQGLALELFGVEVARFAHGRPNLETLIISSTAVMVILERIFGMRHDARSASKAVPARIFTAPESVQWAFLSGLFEGDAHVSHRTRGRKTLAYVEYASASEVLARGVVSLLLRLGIFSVIRSKVKWASNTEAKTRRTYWSVYVYGNEQLRTLAANLRFVGEKRHALARLATLPAGGNPNWDVVPTATDLVHDAVALAKVSVKRNRAGRPKLAAYQERRCHASRRGILEVSAQIEQLGSTPEAARPILDRLETLATSDVYWDEVISVEEFPSPDEWVYDLCVDETHNFVAEDLIVHNSNVADAIRWALGENNARQLRAKRNEELIFSGSDTKRAVGMAEVLLQLDNSARRLPIDFSELEVGRRLFRDGDAEYLVNRSRVRLRDLQDLLAGANLADNPFVVIGQGLVDQVLALRPADRRQVIEDAAGTRRLAMRREEALQRLRHAETELVRVIDILREIGPRVAVLQEQAAKWSEYETIRNELRRRALRWYRSSFGETATQRADLAAKLIGVDREIERLTDLVDEIEGLSAGTDEELQVARSEEERRRILAADALAAESAVRERIAALQAAVEAASAERDRTRTTLASLPAELASLRERRSTVDQETADAARGARESAERARSAEEEASRTRVALAEAQAARIEAERARMLRESEQARLLDDERALAARDEELATAVAGLAAERAAHEREREKVGTELSHARDDAADHDRLVEAAAGRAGSARTELQRIEGDLALLRGQTTALRDSAERVRRELAAREGADGDAPLPRGLTWLHEQLAIPPQLRDTFRVALGERVALAGGEALLPLGEAREVTLLVPSEARMEDAPEGTTRLTQMLKLPAEVRRVAGALFDNVFFAQDTTHVFAAARTLRSGIVVGPYGPGQHAVATPGAVRIVRSDDAARRALEQLRGMAARLGDELAASERALERTVAERDDAERRLVEAEDHLAAAQRERGARERVVDELASRDADIRDLIRAGEARASAVERERADVAARRERIVAERATAVDARAAAGARASAAEAAERAASDAHARAAGAAEDARLDSARNEERRASLVRLRDNLDEQVGATERRIADEESRLRALTAQEREDRERLEAAQRDLGRAAADAREAERSAELARERALAAEGSRRESEQRLARSRERLAELRGERAKLAVEEERSTSALRLLEEQVRAELGLPEDEPLPDPESIGIEEVEDSAERASTMRDLQRLRRRLIALEPVNPLAATELAEVGERHSFLSSQRADLDKAIADLRSLADELATAIAEQFSATFQAVDREFGIFFQRLFNGGQGSLRTSDDPDDPGIEIYARPPGKRIGSLQQLSGGERALTATALLLAILRVKPAPFCVLDEVDAALDERNVGRFTQALRELTDRTQFVVITHNRGTIEAADTLYGVSMDEGGVSKVISLRLADIDERAG